MGPSKLVVFGTRDKLGIPSQLSDPNQVENDTLADRHPGVVYETIIREKRLFAERGGLA